MTDEGCCGTPESGLLSDLICFDGTMSAVLDCSLAEQITPCGSYHDSISAQCVRMILVRVGFPLIQFSSILIRVFVVGVRFSFSSYITMIKEGAARGPHLSNWLFSVLAVW